MAQLQIHDSYKFPQNVDLIDEGLVVLDTLFLNDLDGHIVRVFSVLRQVHLPECSICQFLREVIHFLDLSLVSLLAKQGGFTFGSF